MARSKIQTEQMVHNAALDRLNTVYRDTSELIFNNINTALDFPARISLSSGTSLSVSSTLVTTPEGYNKVFPPIDGKSMASKSGSVTLNTSGSQTSDFATYTAPTGMTTNYYRWAGIDLRSDGKFYIVFGKEAASSSNAEMPVFVGQPIGRILCQAASATTFNNLVKANVQQYVGAGSGSGGGDNSFKIRDISTSTATLAGGQIMLSNGEVLVSGAGTTEDTVKVDISIDLSTVLGGTPENATLYYLYIDRTALSAAINLTDSGRKVINVSSASHFKLLTTAPDATDLNRYIAVAFVRSATSGTQWTGSGAAFGVSPSRTQWLFEPADVEAWATGLAIRSGNIYKVTTEGFEGFWRALSAHTAAATFDLDFEAAKWELVSSWMGPREVIAQPSASYFTVGQAAAVNASGAYVKGLASDSTLSEVKGIVSGATASYFVLSKTGSKVTKTGWALTAGAVQFLDGTTAGAITATEPSTVSYIRLPLGQAVTTTTMDVLVGAGTTVGGTNVYTTIPLNNGGTTALQTVNVAAGEGGFIEGVIKIDADADTVTTFKVEFARPITGTTYTCTPTYGCDALPTGSSIDITTGGVIQLTLPSISGFSSGSARFSMQAAAIGAQLPLQIDAAQVSGAGTPIYGAGAWTFKNSSAATTLSVADSGAVTVGSAATSNSCTVNGPLKLQNATTGNASSQGTVYFGSTNSYRIDAGADFVGFDFYCNSVKVANSTSAGAWTLGPVGSSQVQQLNGEVLIKQAATSGSVRGLTYYDGDSNTCGYVQIDATANTVAYTNSSDARLKTNHRAFDGLALVSQMQPSKYERICNPGVDEIGLVAQELQAVMPEAVVVGGEDATKNPWGVDYGRITPVLVKAIQELAGQVDQLRVANAELSAKVAALEAK